MLVGSLPLAGCYVEPEGPVVAEGYQPQMYNGYVVYYDGAGRPYYNYNGATMWIPESSPYYVGYVNHWRAYGPAYNRWYAGYGARYRGYYRPGGYYHVGAGAYRRR
jgi:hypothetical protein